MNRIKFKCACGAPFAVSEQLAGKRVRCNLCKEIVRVPLVQNRAKQAHLGGPASEPSTAMHRDPPTASHEPVDREPDSAHADPLAGDPMAPAPDVSAKSTDGKIRVTCLCGKPIKAPPSMAGLIGKCPKCGRRLRLPAPPEEELMHGIELTGLARLTNESELGDSGLDERSALIHSDEATFIAAKEPSSMEWMRGSKAAGPSATPSRARQRPKQAPAANVFLPLLIGGAFLMMLIGGFVIAFS